MPHFGLYLSDMRVAQFEESDRLVAFAPDRESLVELLRREKVPMYEDGQWRKTFRRGGPLEWSNDIRASLPPSISFGFFTVIAFTGEDRRIEKIYTLEEYVEKHRTDYKRLLDQAYDAGMIEGTMVVEHLALPAGTGQGDEHGNDDEEDEDREAADRGEEERDRQDDGGR